MPNQVTKKASYGSRLWSSVKGVGTGIILFIVATGLLFYNEYKAVKTYKLIDEVELNVQTLGDSISVRKPDLEGKLVHAYGEAIGHGKVKDPKYAEADGVIAIIRTVEDFRIEKKSESGEETLTPKWVRRPFNRDDPDASQKFFASKVTFGAYELPDIMIEEIIFSPEPLDPNIGAGSGRIITGSEIYYGSDRDNPKEGDFRVKLIMIPSQKISIIAQVIGNQFEVYRAKNGEARTFVVEGQQGVKEILHKARKENEMATWIYRFILMLLVVTGIRLILSILPTILSFWAWLGKVIQAGVNIFAAIVGFCWSVIIICAAWIMVRPLFAIPLLVGAILLIVLYVRKKRAKKAATAPVPDQPATPTPAAAPADKSWTCDCGTVNTAKFCGNCGKTSPFAEVICGNCGWKRPPENRAKFCGNCGNPL